MDVKERLRQLMEERGWTIYKVAKEAGIPWSTLRNLFKRNTEPSIGTLEAICKGMGLTLPQFFDAENNMGLTEEQRLLIGQWNKLDDRKKRLVSELMDAFNDKS